MNLVCVSRIHAFAEVKYSISILLINDWFLSPLDFLFKILISLDTIMNFSELKHSRSGRIKQIFIMSGPYTFSMLIAGVMEAINTYFAGKIGTIEIQATALAMALLIQ